MTETLSSSEPSFEAWWAHALANDATIPFRLSLLRFKRSPYEELVSLIEEALAKAATELSRAKNVVHTESEDQLSMNLVLHLTGMGFQAKFEANNGGNCDISIVGHDSMTWLGEAKIYKGSRNLLSGLRQLVDRYTIGTKGNDCGAVIVYVKSRNAQKIMKVWRERLHRKIKKGEVGPYDPDTMTFRNTIEHAGTGRPLHILHIPIPLYHKATEMLSPPDWENDQPLVLGAQRAPK